MVFLGYLVNIANQSGLLPCLHRNNPCYLLRTVINLIGAFSIAFHSLWFYLDNHSDDFLQATLALNMCSTVIIHVTKALMGLAKNKEFLAVFLRLKRLCDDPCQYRLEIRDRIDQRLQNYAQKIVWFISLGILVVILTPIIVKTVEYFETGDIVKYRWDLPIPYASPFYNLQSSPTYEIVYVEFAISFPPDAFFAYSMGFLFMGISLHIHGLFLELECRFRNLDMTQGRRQFREDCNKCIDFQNEIYEIVKDTQDVFANIFFVQFMGTIIIVCSQAYLATQNTSNGRLLSNIVYTICGAGELFIFTICGSLITTGNELSIRALLDKDCFAMDPAMRRDFAFMVKRSQRLCRISFLNWIHCSLDSLKFVITSSFNMFAMLQHMSRRNGSGRM